MKAIIAIVLHDGSLLATAASSDDHPVKLGRALLNVYADRASALGLVAAGPYASVGSSVSLGDPSQEGLWPRTCRGIADAVDAFHFGPYDSLYFFSLRGEWLHVPLRVSAPAFELLCHLV